MELWPFHALRFAFEVSGHDVSQNGDRKVDREQSSTDPFDSQGATPLAPTHCLSPSFRRGNIAPPSTAPFVTPQKLPPANVKVPPKKQKSKVFIVLLQEEKCFDLQYCL
jgi:hypothetical protein